MHQKESHDSLILINKPKKLPKHQNALNNVVVE
jgi:hypothetical protein